MVMHTRQRTFIGGAKATRYHWAPHRKSSTLSSDTVSQRQSICSKVMPMTAPTTTKPWICRTVVVSPPQSTAQSMPLKVRVVPKSAEQA